MNENNLERYIQHLDIEALRQVIRFAMTNESSRICIRETADEFAVMFNIPEGEQNEMS